MHRSSCFPDHEEADESFTVNVQFSVNLWSLSGLWPAVDELMQLIPDFEQLMAVYSRIFLKGPHILLWSLVLNFSNCVHLPVTEQAIQAELTKLLFCCYLNTDVKLNKVNI